MTRILVIGLFFVLLSFSSHAQNVYSKRNLEQASQEELNLYLGKAWKLEKVGGILFVSGVLGTLTGVILGVHGWNNGNDELYTFGAVMAPVCLGITVVGLPVFITNSLRVKKISGIMANRSERVSIEMVPCGFYNNLAQNYQNGVTLRIRF